MGDRQACLDLGVKFINMEVVNKDLLRRKCDVFTVQVLGSGS